jgi:aconitate hydratase
MARLEKAGAKVLANACGPCIGQWKRDDMDPSEPNTIMSSYNRNFPGRNDGSPQTLSFITSPEITVAFALAGTIDFNPLSDDVPGAAGSFKLTPPKPAPDIPANGYVKDETGYVPPEENSSAIKVEVDPKSERLQVLTPFSKWDGKDFTDLPLLVKTKGKCTTDHISPAGKWLRFRGHLDNISNNMFSGAINAFTGERGKTRNPASGSSGQEISQVARDLKAKGLRWVVVGDENYGEGSSREHAAMSPRLLGAAAVITKSFARIHESNLKKQGVLPLTFMEPADYDKILETDTLTLKELAALQPGQPVKLIVKHEDGGTEEMWLKHSMNSEHIKWFRSGSALNRMREAAKK